MFWFSRFGNFEIIYFTQINWWWWRTWKTWTSFLHGNDILIGPWVIHVLSRPSSRILFCIWTNSGLNVFVLFLVCSCCFFRGRDCFFVSPWPRSTSFIPRWCFRSALLLSFLFSFIMVDGVFVCIWLCFDFLLTVRYLLCFFPTS